MRCVSFHPLGNHIITSTTHPVIRLYDVTTGQCFVCPIPAHQHTKSVNCLKYVLFYIYVNNQHHFVCHQEIFCTGGR